MTTSCPRLSGSSSGQPAPSDVAAHPRRLSLDGSASTRSPDGSAARGLAAVGLARAPTAFTPFLVLAVPLLVAGVELLPPILRPLLTGIRAEAIVSLGVDVVVPLGPVVLQTPPPVHPAPPPRPHVMGAGYSATELFGED